MKREDVLHDPGVLIVGFLQKKGVVLNHFGRPLRLLCVGHRRNEGSHFQWDGSAADRAPSWLFKKLAASSGVITRLMVR